jgi:hypothetical protein
MPLRRLFVEFLPGRHLEIFNQNFPGWNRIEQLEEQHAENVLLATRREIVVVDHVSDKVLADAVASPKCVGEFVFFKTSSEVQGGGSRRNRLR